MPKKKEKLVEASDSINNSSNHPVEINEIFTLHEVKSAIKSLKNGKASSLDMINSEILKCFDDCYSQFLVNFFNLCYDHSVYPWNESIITPLHKTGDVKNPDNSRGITVSSVLGKLFSTILLERLTKFRKENCPDPPNQLGFTKGAQTYDHIFTMQTIISKYKKSKTRFTAFLWTLKRSIL